jgi:hypothetical protein
MDTDNLYPDAPSSQHETSRAVQSLGLVQNFRRAVSDMRLQAARAAPLPVCWRCETLYPELPLRRHHEWEAQRQGENTTGARPHNGRVREERSDETRTGLSCRRFIANLSEHGRKFKRPLEIQIALHCRTCSLVLLQRADRQVDRRCAVTQETRCASPVCDSDVQSVFSVREVVKGASKKTHKPRTPPQSPWRSQPC